MTRNCDLQAEQALLGILLYDNEAFYAVDACRAEDFSEPLHQRIYALIEDLALKNRLADPVTINSRLSGDVDYTSFGGMAFLADLVDRAPPRTTAAEYARTIADMGLRRRLVDLLDESREAASDQTRDAKEWLSEVEQGLFQLGEAGPAQGGFQDFSHAIDGAVQVAADAFRRDGKISGIATGFIDLDHKLGGLHPSDLIIIAGRPSMGKTAIVTNMAYNIAKAYRAEPLPDGSKKTIAGGIVGFFSLEMSSEQLGQRILADVSGIASERLRRGDIDIQEFSQLRDCAAEVRMLPLHIDQTGALSIAKLAARARRLKRRFGLDILIIDYLQLATATSKGQGRVQEVSEITAALKALAKELQVPVIALSQLSRQVENREDKRPQLSDLRESGSIEQDADVVMFVYREEYYLGRTEPKVGGEEHYAWEEKMSQAANQAEIIIGKQRHGPIGTVKLHFNGELTRFGNLANTERFGRDTYGRGA